MATLKKKINKTAEESPAPAKTAKPVRKRIAPKKAAIIQTTQYPVKDLKVYHKNPRIGDIDMIAESMERNGQFKPIVVNVGTHTGRPNEILAGNHSYLAARKLGWERIYATFVDVDDERAAAVVLADNKTASRGTYDEKLMGELLAQVPDVLATGFKPEEADDLIAAAGAAASSALADLEESGALDMDFGPAPGEDGDASGGSMFESLARPAMTDDDDIEEFDPVADDPDKFMPESEPESKDSAEITSKSSEIEGIAKLAPVLPEEPAFWKGYLQMPAIRTDMLMRPEDWPENIQTWAGSASRELAAENDDIWFHYPWGGDSTNGLKHTNQVILSFYSWDEAFINWFWTPDKYAAKVLNSGIKYAITPDYSMWASQSRFLNLWSQYRNLYVARYLQEVGIKIIPHIGAPFGDFEFMEKYIWPSWPKHLPMLAKELQNFDKDFMKDKKNSDTVKTGILKTLEWYTPEAFVLYTGKKGRDWFNAEVRPHISKDIQIIDLDARSEILTRWRVAKNAGKKKNNTI